MSDNNDNSKKKDPRNNVPGARENNRSPRAAVVWLVIMLLIGGLFLFKGFGSGRSRDLSQSQFESMLKAKLIATAVLVSEGDMVFTVEGTLNSPKNDSGKQAETKKAGAEKLRYRTRVIYSDTLNELLAYTNVQVDSNNAGIWNFVLFALLPVIIIVGMIYFFSARQMRGHGAMDFGRRMEPVFGIIGAGL